MVSFSGGDRRGDQPIGGLEEACYGSSVIVMKDCDFDKAVEGSVSGAFWVVGQNYIGAQRILIQADLNERDPIWGDGRRP